MSIELYLAMASLAGVLLLFLAVRTGFKNVSENLNDHSTRLDHHRRESIIHKNRHSAKIEELESRVNKLHESMEALKASVIKEKNKTKIVASN